jgi:hypothetical protein
MCHRVAVLVCHYLRIQQPHATLEFFRQVAVHALCKNLKLVELLLTCYFACAFSISVQICSFHKCSFHFELRRMSLDNTTPYFRAQQSSDTYDTRMDPVKLSFNTRFADLHQASRAKTSRNHFPDTLQNINMCAPNSYL